MPINHHLKVVFVHVPKTAGSSIEDALEMRDSEAREEILSGYINNERYKKYSTPWSQHLKASEISEIKPGVMKEYFSFAVVRNPYERAVSSWLWKQKKGIARSGIQLRDFLVLKYSNDNHHLSQVDFITKNEEIIVDKIIRFEELEEGWKEICNILGIEKKLPHLNKSSGVDHYSKYYDFETRRLLERIYWRDLDFFNYKFSNKV